MAEEFGLRWAIKRSFVEYVLRMPDGQAQVGLGAQPAGTDEVLFAPESTGQRPGPGGSVERLWTFSGDVRFSGHFGMLFVRIAQPRIALVDGVAHLDIADPTTEDPDGRLELLTFKLTEQDAEAGVERWAGTDTGLTAAGSELFNGVYPAGEPFEDLTMVLPIVARGDRSG